MQHDARGLVRRDQQRAEHGDVEGDEHAEHGRERRQLAAARPQPDAALAIAITAKP